MRDAGLTKLENSAFMVLMRISIMIEVSKTGPIHMYEKLDVHANKFRISIQIIFLTAVAVILPFVGWYEFGPDAVGDTSKNGNSIFAFWVMRVLLASFTLGALFSLHYQWRLWRRVPLLFSLQAKGITDRTGAYYPWRAFKRAYMHKGTLYLVTGEKPERRTIVVEPNEIGFRATDQIVAFIRKHAPIELGSAL